MAKPKKTPFTIALPRKTTATVARCFGDPALFVADLAPSARAEFATNGPIPCGGGGVPGVWCDGCRFGVVDAAVEIEGA
jgi:hypothetical protein